MSVFQRVFRYFQLRDADRQGDGRLVQMFGGADKADFTRGDIAVFDASGSVIDGGPPSSNSGGFGSWYEQVPIGLMNSANRDFFLDFVPLFDPAAPHAYVILEINGYVQDPYFDFHLSINSNHLLMRIAPKASDRRMVIWYFRGIPTFTPGGQPPPIPPPAPPPPGGISGCSSGTVTTLAGGGLHPYWRLNILSNRTDGTNNGAGDVAEVTELEFHSTVGGSDITSGGSALAIDSIFSSPDDAFDDNLATAWASNGTVGEGTTWIGYHFSAPVSIVEFALTNAFQLGNWAGHSPCLINLDWSDDGTNWTTGWQFALNLACWTGPAQTMVFTTDSTGAPPPPPPPAPTATLDIWADYPGTVNGVPAVSYTLDGGLTWVGGDGTLPGDAGISV